MFLAKFSDEELAEREAELEKYKTDLRLRKLAIRDEVKAANEELAAIRAELTARHVAARGDVPPMQSVGGNGR